MILEVFWSIKRRRHVLDVNEFETTLFFGALLSLCFGLLLCTCADVNLFWRIVLLLQ